MTQTSSQVDEVRQAAQQLLTVADRVFGGVRQDSGPGGGVFHQIARGDWDDRWTDASATDAVATMRRVAEELRQSRVDVDRLASDRPPNEGRLDDTIRSTAAQLLPLNRKERYYTGTVLPMLALSDDFAYADRLLSLCGLPGIDLKVQDSDGGEVQVFTEYSFAESVFMDADRARFDGRPPVADTPDLVLAGADWLLAIEAKLFDQPSSADLRRQLHAQSVLVDYWRETLGLPSDRVAHVALLPARLAARIGPLSTPVVTWEDVSEAYEQIGPRYWSSILRVALTSELYGREDYGFGANKHDSLTGAEIVSGFLTEELAYLSMGRAGGLEGRLLAADVETGAWRSQSYEVRRDGLPNRNWFLVADFVQRVQG